MVAKNTHHKKLANTVVKEPKIACIQTMDNHSTAKEICQFCLSVLSPSFQEGEGGVAEVYCLLLSLLFYNFLLSTFL
jgi:hypothetical protein